MKAKELIEKKNEELVLEKDKLIKEYRDLRFKKVTSIVENPMRIKLIRKDIARINTILHIRELDKIKNELNK
ncbi:MAG: 50S ribosomal protein L29 [Spirochaetes bacterium GWD1_27_9]|nr:MAG: 50S ribosomal protein L29 [Spirochaetes bacterium GWB1_27_13]OHD21028.1 MAG: 50S ribosomal protein L29 [Spirochaetes bacterium GWC1_27_15]OHD45389.1 MAG: 50S ribosomal protein L29 [Spirochaetes bacterium GWD1_27_9]